MGGFNFGAFMGDDSQQGLSVYHPVSASAAGGLSTQVWNKPRHGRLVYVWVLNAGGGGGAGLTGSPAGARGGGAGGAGGCFMGALIPFFTIPDRLYINVGRGGAAAASSGSAGGTGGITNVYASKDASSLPIIRTPSGGSIGGPAGTGAGAATGPGGNTNVQGLLSIALGISFTLPGIGGGSGGNAANGAGSGVAHDTVITAGCGGGGGGGVTSADQAGGAIGAVAPEWGSTTIVPGGAAGSNPGGTGFGTFTPQGLYIAGGGGGGSSNNGTGGAGGDGGWGCGGGGGGAGNVGGAGGRGGDGLVYIIVI